MLMKYVCNLSHKFHEDFAMGKGVIKSLKRGDVFTVSPEVEVSQLFQNFLSSDRIVTEAQWNKKLKAEAKSAEAEVVPTTKSAEAEVTPTTKAPELETQEPNKSDSDNKITSTKADKKNSKAKATPLPPIPTKSFGSGAFRAKAS